MEPQTNASCTTSRIDWDALDDEQILNLNTYDFMGYLGKRVINPGGLEGRDLIIKELDIRPGTRILEVGGGNGEAACFIAQHYDCNLISIDLSEHLVKEANKLITEKGLLSRVKSLQGDITSLDFSDNYFDYVISQGVIMLVDQEKALTEIIRVLKPGGSFSGLEFCWKKTPPKTVTIDTYNICGCQSLMFHSKNGWSSAFESNGFQKVNIIERPFNLFSILGFIRDEGLINSLRIFFRVLSNPSVNQRMRQIWNHFSCNLEYIDYMVYSCKKPFS